MMMVTAAGRQTLSLHVAGRRRVYAAVPQLGQPLLVVPCDAAEDEDEDGNAGGRAHGCRRRDLESAVVVVGHRRNLIYHRCLQTISHNLVAVTSE